MDGPAINSVPVFSTNLDGTGMVLYMSRTLQTKKIILKILADRAKTLSDISRELQLAPSTISQHLRELMMIGAIHQVDNPFVKKWKYYRKTPDFKVEKKVITELKSARIMMSVTSYIK